MPEAILEVSDIRAGYGKIEVLHGVSIRAREEQTTCIIGPNGCGKSTLFNVICGVIKSTSGNVTFCGEDITRLSSDAILSRGISVSPQGRRVFPFMSVDENLEMGGYTTKNREELDRRKDEIYSQFYRLRERKNQLAGSLSGGEQVLLCLARSLIMRPRIVLLDEPSLGLAPNVREEVFQSILDMKKSLLIIEQNVRKAINISDYVYVLDLGKNKFEGTPKQILENQDLVKLYMGKLAQMQNVDETKNHDQRLLQTCQAFDKMMKEKRKVIQALKGIRRTHTYTKTSLQDPVLSLGRVVTELLGIDGAPPIRITDAERTRISKQKFAGPEIPYEARVVQVVANPYTDMFNEQVAFADEEPQYKYYWAHACVLNGISKIHPINCRPGGGEASVLPDERISLAQLVAAAKGIPLPRQKPGELV